MMLVCLVFSGADYILCLKLLRGRQQQRRLHQDGPRPGATLCSVSNQQDEPRAHAQAKVCKGPKEVRAVSCSQVFLQKLFKPSASAGQRDQLCGL